MALPCFSQKFTYHILMRTFSFEILLSHIVVILVPDIQENSTYANHTCIIIVLSVSSFPRFQSFSAKTPFSTEIKFSIGLS
jgi:hypothetical protein